MTRWDEMRLQEEEREEDQMIERGESFGEGIEVNKRPIGFGHKYEHISPLLVK